MKVKPKPSSVPYVVPARHYCAINPTVPVLKRYLGGEDTHPEFWLGREATQQLLVALKTVRQHGWGPTLETLVFLFWLATGSAYKVVSMVLDMPLLTVHRIIHRMADELVAVLPLLFTYPAQRKRSRQSGTDSRRWLGTVPLPRQQGQWMAATSVLNVLGALMVRTTKIESSFCQ